MDTPHFDALEKDLIGAFSQKHMIENKHNI